MKFFMFLLETPWALNNQNTIRMSRVFNFIWIRLKLIKLSRWRVVFVKIILPNSEFLLNGIRIFGCVKLEIGFSENIISKICSRIRFTVFHKIDFTEYSLHWYNPPAWELTCIKSDKYSSTFPEMLFSLANEIVS